MDGLFRFIGEDCSLGLTRGNSYRIVLDEEKGKIFASVLLLDRFSFAYDVDRIGVNGYQAYPGMQPYVFCPYDNELKFLENWQPA